MKRLDRARFCSVYGVTFLTNWEGVLLNVVVRESANLRMVSMSLIVNYKMNCTIYSNTGCQNTRRLLYG